MCTITTCRKTPSCTFTASDGPAGRANPAWPSRSPLLPTARRLRRLSGASASGYASSRSTAKVRSPKKAAARRLQAGTPEAGTGSATVRNAPDSDAAHPALPDDPDDPDDPAEETPATAAAIGGRRSGPGAAREPLSPKAAIRGKPKASPQGRRKTVLPMAGQDGSRAASMTKGTRADPAAAKDVPGADLQAAANLRAAAAPGDVPVEDVPEVETPPATARRAEADNPRPSPSSAFGCAHFRANRDRCPYRMGRIAYPVICRMLEGTLVSGPCSFGKYWFRRFGHVRSAWRLLLDSWRNPCVVYPSCYSNENVSVLNNNRFTPQPVRQSASSGGYFVGRRLRHGYLHPYRRSASAAPPSLLLYADTAFASFFTGSGELLMAMPKPAYCSIVTSL